MIASLEKQAIKVKGDFKIITQVGTISANNEEAIGKQIADAMQKVGEDGVITVEEGKGIKDEVDVVEGMQFDRGYMSPHFVTDPDQPRPPSSRNPYILIHEKKIGSPVQADPPAREARQGQPPLLVIAEEVEGEALATLVVNNLRKHPQVRRGQGAGLRRPPQGHAPGHRHPHRRQGHLRGPRHRPQEPRALRSRHRQEA